MVLDSDQRPCDDGCWRCILGYSCKILLDSVAPCGARLTTFEVSFPRIILAEFNTHRMLSRNSASSRAIPVEKMLRRVLDDPFIPVHWGKNQAGMQAERELTVAEQERALSQWLLARDEMVLRVRQMLDIGLHKQVTNRLLEPWMYHTCVVSATEWQNFFALRCHPAAMPEIRRIAEMMRDAYVASVPQRINADDWHLPFVTDEDRSAVVELTPDPAGTEYRDFMVRVTDTLKKVSASRCARVSYLTHDGKRDLQADIDLCDRLAGSGHMSPLEHVAQALDEREWHGNFCGWYQYRKEFPSEAVFLG